jgi:hypothetical protein
MPGRLHSAVQDGAHCGIVVHYKDGDRKPRRGWNGEPRLGWGIGTLGLVRRSYVREGRSVRDIRLQSYLALLALLAAKICTVRSV